MIWSEGATFPAVAIQTPHGPPPRFEFGPTPALTFGLLCMPIGMATWSEPIVITGAVLVGLAVIHAVLLAIRPHAPERGWNLWVAFHGLVYIGGFTFGGITSVPHPIAVLIVWGAILAWPPVCCVYAAVRGSR